MTKGEGQRAMAVAMIHPEPEKGGRGKKAGYSKETLGFSAMLLSLARHVLAVLPETARLVLAGEKPLQGAYDEARQGTLQRRRTLGRETAAWATESCSAGR